MGNWFKKFIEKLAKVNTETFQGQKLNCCDLNKQTKSVGKEPNNNNFRGVK